MAQKLTRGLGLFAPILAQRSDPTRPAMSPSPDTGGSVPLPSFGPNGEYFPPTEVPIGSLLLQPPRNQLWRSELTPEEREELQRELIGKLKAWNKSAVPQKLSF